MYKTFHSAEYAAFLKLLRRTRERLDLTQEELARRLNTKQAFISKCERGERRIDVVELRAFCKAMGISLAAFIAEFETIMAGSLDHPGGADSDSSPDLST